MNMEQGGVDRGIDPKEFLNKAQDLIPVLIKDTLSTKVFSSKWQTIRTKLQELNQSLSSVADCSQWAENSLLKEILPGVISSLRQIRDLAKSCTEVKFSGKLLMQSDLDVSVSKLNLHLRDLDLLLRSGVLGEKNSEGSCGGDEVFVVKDLFARLQIGNAEQKNKAMNSLINLLEEDKPSVLSVAKEGDIGYLLQLLDSNVIALREQTAVAVSILARSDSCKACLLGQDTVVPPLIRVLESGSALAKVKAAEALHALTVNNSENSWAVSANGGVSALVKICRNGILELQEIGARILVNLCAVEEIRISMAEEGAIPVLINLLNSSSSASVRLSAANSLDLLAADDEKRRQMIESKRGVESFFMFLEGADTPQGREVAFRAINSLSVSPSAARVLIDSPKFLKLLVLTLDRGHSVIQNLAASVICNLSQTEETTRVLGEVGCIPLLARMLDGKPSSSQEIAARALSALFAVRSNRKEFIKDDEGVFALVQLLDPENETVAKKFPLLAVEALSNSNNCRKKITLAGACQHLEKLARMEVIGAKRVLNKIEGGKLRQILSRKWRV